MEQSVAGRMKASGSDAFVEAEMVQLSQEAIFTIRMSSKVLTAGLEQ